jgi:hypothetical protein
MTYAFYQVDWASIGIWVSAAMELAVALVILYEVEQHRRASFLEEASREEHLKEKREIYKLFLETEGATVEAKTEEFCRSLWDNPDLRGKCDTQLVLFNKLGYLLTPRPISSDREQRVGSSVAPSECRNPLANPSSLHSEKAEDAWEVVGQAILRIHGGECKVSAERGRPDT